MPISPDQKRKNGKLYSPNPRNIYKNITKRENKMIEDARKNNYGDSFMPYFEGQVDFFVDSDGTDYAVNQHMAEYHYKWTLGSKGIGYYLQN